MDTNPQVTSKVVSPDSFNEPPAKSARKVARKASRNQLIGNMDNTIEDIQALISNIGKLKNIDKHEEVAIQKLNKSIEKIEVASNLLSKKLGG